MKELLVTYAFPGLVAFIMALGTYFLKKLTSWLIIKSEASDAEKEAYQCLLEGMAVAQEQIVREAKAASVDGKLTKEEMIKAEQIALAFAKEVATGPAKDVVINWTTSRVSSLIKQLLAKLKSKKEKTNVSTPVDPSTPA